MISLTKMSMISLTKTSMIFYSWMRKQIILTKPLIKITLERKILENAIGKENNIIDKNVNDIWFFEEKKDIIDKNINVQNIGHV